MDKESFLYNSSHLYENRRLVEISDALRRLEKRCGKYLSDFEHTEDWRRYKEGFVHLNAYMRPEDVVELKTCDLADAETAFYRPEAKKIIVCANKIHDKEHFNKVLIYNLTIMYDNTRANVDWNNCMQMSCMLVRALNLSQKCRAEDTDCFKKYLRAILYSKDACKDLIGQEERCFLTSYKSCIKDLAPINTLKVSKSGEFFE